MKRENKGFVATLRKEGKLLGIELAQRAKEKHKKIAMEIQFEKSIQHLSSEDKIYARIARDLNL